MPFLQLSAQYNHTTESYSDSSISIEFSFVGDIMCHSTQYSYSMLPDSTFDFKPVYREIKQYFENSDIVVGNLETVIAGEQIDYAGYPIFNTPDAFLEGLNHAGFDILVTGNNHAYDQKETGVLNTIDFIHKYNMVNSGTYKSKLDRDSIKIFEKNGISFTILSYTYDVNFFKIPDNKNYLVNRINSDLIKKDIQKTRSKNVDIVMVYFHFGTEYALKENSYQTDIVKKTVAYGADLIIGAHPHSLQPVELYKTKNANIDSGFVAYSLGNFISNQRWRYSDGGAILNFTISKNKLTSEVTLEEVRYLPIWVFKGVTDWGWEYVILPSEMGVHNSYPFYVTENDKILMLECYNDSNEILQSRTNQILIDTMEKSNLRNWMNTQGEFRKFIFSLPIIDYNLLSQSVFKDTLNYSTIELSQSYLEIIE